MNNIVMERNFLEYPLADLAALKAIDTTLVNDGALYKVKTLGLFFLDKTSIEAANDIDIIAPTVGSGRFKRLTLPFMATNTNGTKIDPSMLGYDEPFELKGELNAASDCPTLADVKNGWTYTIGTTFTDNDATKTNTGQVLTAGSVVYWIFDTPNKWVYFTGTGTKYTNATPMPQAIGGYTAGTTFNAADNDTMWTGLLYPYQGASFNSFSIAAQSVSVEVGDKIIGDNTFNWTISNIANVDDNTTNVVDISDSITLASGLPKATLLLAYDFSLYPGGGIQLLSPGVHIWQVQATNTNSAQFTRNFIVSWYWRDYYGTNASQSLTEAQIKTLVGGGLTGGIRATLSFASGGYKHYCIPSSFTQPTSFKDASTGFDIGMSLTETVSVTNALGVTTNYSHYATDYPLGDAVTIIVS